ncbi:MAG TPA: hypothetical protein PK843_06660 [bacterium]|nr:hypothetical protein [bacterium]HPN34174.1 hypothetical protein [bacterium]
MIRSQYLRRPDPTLAIALCPIVAENNHGLVRSFVQRCESASLIQEVDDEAAMFYENRKNQFLTDTRANVAYVRKTFGLG